MGYSLGQGQPIIVLKEGTEPVSYTHLTLPTN